MKIHKMLRSLSAAVLFGSVVSVCAVAASAEPTEKEKAEAMKKLQQAADETLKPSGRVPVSSVKESPPPSKAGEKKVQAVYEGKIVTAVSLAKLKSMASTEMPNALANFNKRADDLAKVFPFLRNDVARCKTVGAQLLKDFQSRVASAKVGDQLKVTIEDKPAVIPGGLLKIVVDAKVTQ